MVKPEKSDTQNDIFLNRLNSETELFVSNWIQNILKTDNSLSNFPSSDNFIPRSISPNVSSHSNRSLFPAEIRLLTEIDLALGVFEDETQLPLSGVVTNLVGVFNWPSVYARRIVKFCKSMSAFKILPQDDQLLILKYFYMNLLTCRVSFTWNEAQFGYPIIADETGKEAVFLDFTFALQLKNQQIFRHSFECIQKFYAFMEKDETIRNLVRMPLLFVK